MKHGFLAAIIEWFRNLHGDAATFVKWAGIGGGSAGIFLFNSSLHVSDLVFTLIIKACYTGSIAIFSGMLGVIGKKIGHWVASKFKRKKKPDSKNTFSKNGKQDAA